jgi:cellobiose-specific phosphotransferase system component IIB
MEICIEYGRRLETTISLQYGNEYIEVIYEFNGVVCVHRRKEIDVMVFTVYFIDGTINKRGWCNDSHLLIGPHINYINKQIRIFDENTDIMNNINELKYFNVSDDILHEMIADYEKMKQELTIIKK